MIEVTPNAGPQSAGAIGAQQVRRYTLDLGTLLAEDFGGDTISDIDVTATDAELVIGDGATAPPVTGATLSGVPPAPSSSGAVITWYVWPDSTAVVGAAYGVTVTVATATNTERMVFPLTLDISRGL